ncbi:MAG: FliM/FliN family flagellar motor switch protein [Planctomycetota bacterium]
MRNIEVEIKVILATRKLKLGEILKLTEGSIIEFPKNIKEEIPLYVDNVEFARGIIVKVQGRFGLQIKSMVQRS